MFGFFKKEDASKRAIAFGLACEVNELAEIYEERRIRLKKKRQSIEVFFKTIVQLKIKELDLLLFCLRTLQGELYKVPSTQEDFQKEKEYLEDKYGKFANDRKLKKKNETLFQSILEFFTTDEFKYFLTASQEPH